MKGWFRSMYSEDEERNVVSSEGHLVSNLGSRRKGRDIAIQLWH